MEQKVYQDVRRRVEKKVKPDVTKMVRYDPDFPRDIARCRVTEGNCKSLIYGCRSFACYYLSTMSSEKTGVHQLLNEPI